MATFEVDVNGTVYEIEAPSAEVAASTAAKLKAPAQSTAPPAEPMGTDNVSGDSIRAAAAGNTRPKMPLPDIQKGYQEAQRQGNRAEQQAMAEAYVTREKQENPTGMAVSDGLRQIAKGVPVIGKWLDEFSAFTSAPLDNKKYEEVLDYQRARDRTFEKANPKTSMGLQIAGGVGSAVAAAPTFLGTIGNSATRLNALLKAIGIGATAGGIDSFADGEGGFENRLADAGTGALVGGAVGGAVLPIAAGLGKGAEYLMKNSARKTAGAIDPATGKAFSAEAERVLQRSLSNDDVLSQTGATRLKGMGDQTMLAEAGPSSTSLLDTLLQSGGKGIKAGKDAIETRAAGANKTVTEALDSTMGKPKGVATTVQDIREAGWLKTDPLYQRAYAQPIDYASEAGMKLEAMLDRIPGAAIQRAKELMRVEGNQSKQILADVMDDGSVVYKRMPDVMQFDYMTRALNDVAKEGVGKGAGGGFTHMANAYKNLATEIRDELRTHVPDYGRALAQARDPIVKREAVELGSQALSPSVARDEFAMALKPMSPEQRQHAVSGMRADLDERLAQVRALVSDPNRDAREATQAVKDLSSRAVQDKISMLIGPDKTAQVVKVVDEAQRALQLRGQVARNSATYSRQVTKEAVDALNEPGIKQTFVEAGERGGVSNGIRAALRPIVGVRPEVQQAKTDALYGELIRALTGPQGPAAEQMAQSLMRRAAQDEAIGRGIGRAGTTFLGSAGGGAAYQASRPKPTREALPPRR
jgi:hypothetical protein